jgi:ATP-dependent exoDNAse (exonuclease V) beta subunit
VGDIKQAIYGFRGSDTTLMTKILAALHGLGGESEVLPNSWRSRPALVQLANAVFTPAFAGQLQPSEIELKPVRCDKDDGLAGPALLNWMLNGPNIGERNAALAAAIESLVASGEKVFDKETRKSRALRYADIAILCRLNDGVAEVAAALKDQGVPSATSKAGLLATPEATLALACLRRLNDTGDTLATAEIVSLADGAEPESWVADRLCHLAAEDKKSEWLEVDTERGPAHPLLARLAAMRPRLALLSPAEALQAVMTECDLPAVVLRWKPDAEVARQRLANLEQLAGLATQYEDACRNEQRAASVTGLILWLFDLADEGRDGLAEPDTDAVRVLTHHAAKGLEWPVVVLKDLEANLKDRLWGISTRSPAKLDINEPLKGRAIRYWPWPFAKQQKVDVADTIAQTDLAKGFHDAAVEEGKRLLYVSMTRARDILILARNAKSPTGEWIDSLEAPWLLGDEECTAVTLPDGKKLAARTTGHAATAPQGAKSASNAGLHWFAPCSSIEREALTVSPSSAALAGAQVLETVAVGERIPLSGNPDMDKVGNAIHACLALACADPSRPIVKQEVERLLAGQGVETQVQARDVLRQVQAFLAWVGERWGQVEALAELPVQSVLANGQVLQGRMDLLLRTPRGLVLMDHKSNPKGRSHWPELAAEHAGQLDAYARAIHAASGENVTEKWLFLPVAGGAIRVGSTGEMA